MVSGCVDSAPRPPDRSPHRWSNTVLSLRFESQSDPADMDRRSRSDGCAIGALSSEHAAFQQSGTSPHTDFITCVGVFPAHTTHTEVQLRHAFTSTQRSPCA